MKKDSYMDNWTQRFLGFDTETTGLDTSTSRIVEIALVTRTKSNDIGLVGDSTVNQIINIGEPIPDYATKIHGISNEIMEAEGQDAVKVLDKTADAIVEAAQNGTPTVAFNANYDFSILKSELLRYDLPTIEDRFGGEFIHIVDPLVLDRALSIRKGKRRLVDMANHYNIPVIENDLHRASIDVAIMLDVLDAIIQKYPQLEAMTIEELWEFQIKEIERFQAYLKSVGRI